MGWELSERGWTKSSQFRPVLRPRDRKLKSADVAQTLFIQWRHQTSLVKGREENCQRAAAAALLLNMCACLVELRLSCDEEWGFEFFGSKSLQKRSSWSRKPTFFSLSFLSGPVPFYCGRDFGVDPVLSAALRKRGCGFFGHPAGIYVLCLGISCLTYFAPSFAASFSSWEIGHTLESKPIGGSYCTPLLIRVRSTFTNANLILSETDSDWRPTERPTDWLTGEALSPVWIEIEIKVANSSLLHPLSRREKRERMPWSGSWDCMALT